MYKIIKIKFFYIIVILILCSLMSIRLFSIFINQKYINYPKISASISTNMEPMKSKSIYLTFDDGPSKNTRALLKVLNTYNVKATFFVIGNNEKEKRLMNEIVIAGHTIAPHSCCHRYEIIYKSLNNYLTDFYEIEKTIYESTGEKNKIFRFPGGSANCNAPPKIMKQIINEMTNRGYSYYDWNIVSGDDTAIVYPPQTLFNNICSQAKGKDSLVILFHDTNLTTTTPEAVKMVIEYYQKQGYEFFPLTRNVKPIQFKKSAYLQY